MMESCISRNESKESVVTSDLISSIELENSISAEVNDTFDDVSNASVPSRVVIVTQGEEDGIINSNSNSGSCDSVPIASSCEPPTKRLFLETMNPDGQTYVLTLHEINPESGLIHATPIKLEEKLSFGEVALNPLDNDDEEAEATTISDVSQAWFTSREDKSSLHSKGHNWKQGMWSKEEAELLDSNIKRYCMEHSITDPAEVIFEMTKDERKDFYRTIAKGLNRPLFSVYRRVLRMYDNKNHVGKYTTEEIEKLKRLRTKHGNDWQAIGNQMGRSASSIKDKCRLMKDNCNTGKWFPHEENRLADAVYELSNALPGEMVTTGISWASVAERVSTRSEKQCRTKWLNYLNWKQVGGSEWTREDDVTLVTKMCSLDLLDENDIDWAEMAKGWNSVRSPQWLRGKWWSLKRHVPNSTQMTFKEICQYLYRHHVENVHLTTQIKDTVAQLTPASVVQPELGVVTSVATPTITLPQVSIVQLPLPLKSDALGVSSDQPTRLKLDSSTESSLPLQTFEILPPGLQLASATSSGQTFFIAPSQTTCTTIPYATCASSTTGPIIIQTIPTETLEGNENMAMHMNISSQLIINTQPDGTNITSFAAADNEAATINLSGSLPKDTMPSFIQDHGLRLSSGDAKSEDDCSEMVELAYGTQALHSVQDIEPASVTTSAPELGSSIDSGELDHSQHSIAAQFMLSDPILQSQHDSPNPMVSTSDLEDDKENDECDSLDHVVDQDI